jgi:hypothetical protein
MKHLARESRNQSHLGSGCPFACDFQDRLSVDLESRRYVVRSDAVERLFSGSGPSSAKGAILRKIYRSVFLNWAVGLLQLHRSGSGSYGSHRRWVSPVQKSAWTSMHFGSILAEVRSYLRPAKGVFSLERPKAGTAQAYVSIRYRVAQGLCRLRERLEGSFPVRLVEAAKSLSRECSAR